MKNDSKRLFSILGIGVFAIPLILSLISTYNAYSVFFGSTAKKLESNQVESLITKTFFGVIGWPLLGVVCIIFIAIILDGLNYRRKWIFWILLMMGFLWLACIPAGSVFVGLPLLIYLLIKKNTFI